MEIRQWRYILEMLLAGFTTLTWMLWLTFSFIQVSEEDFFDFLVLVSQMELVFTMAALFILPFVFAGGIIADRIIDLVFDALFGNRIILKSYGVADSSPEEKKKAMQAYFQSITEISLKSHALQDRYLTQRRKIRITRMWSVNSVIILISFNLFMYTNFGYDADHVGMYLAFNLLWMAQAFFAFVAWRSLSHKECQILQVEHQLLMPDLEATDED